MQGKSYTAAEYAKEFCVSETTARRRLNALVEDGKANVYSNRIIDHRSRKVGCSARSRSVAVYGNVWILK